MAHPSPQFLSSTPGKCLARLFLALLALAVISGGSLAAGDLFDDKYKDCPARTRLRDGQIDDLSVARDAEEADEVNVSWSTTDPNTWGLGSNTYRTTLVAILDDGGDPQTKTVSLATNKVTFDKVARGAEVDVQLAIVTNTADGDYLISDLLEASTFQSLSKPKFSTDLMRHVVAVAAIDATPTLQAYPGRAVMQSVKGGTFHYIGYNDNFANYRADGITTNPSTPRVRVGLAHGGETEALREDVDFDAYIIRIEADGDVVSSADDVATIKSNYKKAGVAQKLVVGATAVIPTTGDDAGNLVTAVQADPDNNVAGEGEKVVQKHVTGTGSTTTWVNKLSDDGLEVGQITKDTMARSVRINDGEVRPATLVQGHTFTDFTANAVVITAGATVAKVESIPNTTIGTGTIYAEPPAEHRDFPIGMLESDETYTIKAWAVNDDNEVISPVASIEVHLSDEDIPDIPTGFDDMYLNSALTTAVTKVVLTTFTVLK